MSSTVFEKPDKSTVNGHTNAEDVPFTGLSPNSNAVAIEILANSDSEQNMHTIESQPLSATRLHLHFEEIISMCDSNSETISIPTDRNENDVKPKLKDPKKYFTWTEMTKFRTLTDEERESLKKELAEENNRNKAEGVQENNCVLT